MLADTDGPSPEVAIPNRRSSDRTAPAGPIATGIRSIPRASSNPKTVKGVRLTAARNPTSATHAATGVARPRARQAAAMSVTRTSARTAVEDERAKNQLHCHGWSFIRHTSPSRSQPCGPKKASTSISHTAQLQARSVPAMIRTIAKGSGSAGVNQKRSQASPQAANHPCSALPPCPVGWPVNAALPFPPALDPAAGVDSAAFHGPGMTSTGRGSDRPRCGGSRRCWRLIGSALRRRRRRRPPAVSRRRGPSGRRSCPRGREGRTRPSTARPPRHRVAAATAPRPP